jgi:murein L,D-transpeptidase YcbB/YkuD
MRKYWLATSAAALVLSLVGPALAEQDQVPGNSTTVAPPAAASSQGLMFSKDAPNAKPIEQAAPAQAPAQAEPVTPAPATQATAPDSQPAKQATAMLSPEDAAVAGQLKSLIESKLNQYVPREHDRAGVLAFYQGRDFAPLWTASGKVAPRAQQAMDVLHGVAADGLDPADYPTPRLADADPAKLAADELALTNSVLTFARHASIGRVAFTRVSGAVYYDQKAPDAADVLARLAASTDLRATLDAFNPHAPQYKALKAELAAVRNGKEAAPEPKPAAVQNAKHRHGAVAAKPEAKSKDAKIDSILANMERWRWMPHDLGPTYVMVNIPDYTLKVVKDGKTVWQTKIVVGKPGTHATPLLTETMKYITVNPTWNVPPSIIRNEYLPALAQDPNALARVGLKVSHNPDGSIRIFQPPGERNALGRIRFNFPNRFLVYQHDTPDKHLFAQATRAYSHGCMRVQNPDEYAEVLLGITQAQDHYTAAKIRSMYGTTEHTINLKQHIPVYITYQTAFADDAGKAQSRADIYGLDRDMANLMHGERRNADVPVARNYNSSSKPVASAAAGIGRERRGGWGYQPGYSSNPGYTTYGSGSNDYGWNLRSAFQPTDRTKVQ